MSKTKFFQHSYNQQQHQQQSHGMFCFPSTLNSKFKKVQKSSKKFKKVQNFHDLATISTPARALPV
jgi:hypothetical protein